jgi:polyferredoxin
VLYPQDLIYPGGAAGALGAGAVPVHRRGRRLWCGYTCPQTVYTEIFMWVERKIEGDRIARMRWTGPWSAGQARRKAPSRLAWMAIALWTGFTFVGYFTPIRELAGPS